MQANLENSEDEVEVQMQEVEYVRMEDRGKRKVAYALMLLNKRIVYFRVLFLVSSSTASSSAIHL